MSPILQEFYNEIGKWVDGSCKEDTYYDVVGLCSNLDFYIRLLSDSEQDEIVSELREQFENAGLSVEYPFNETKYSYQTEVNMYANEDRLAWIEAHRSDT